MSEGPAPGPPLPGRLPPMTATTSAQTPPRVEYAETADGVSIAFWRLGAGPVLIHLPTPSLMDTRHAWEISLQRRWFERLAVGHQLVFFDPRGAGDGPRS